MKYIKAARRSWPEYWGSFLNGDKQPELTVEPDPAARSIKFTYPDWEICLRILSCFHGYPAETHPEECSAVIRFPNSSIYKHAHDWFTMLAYQNNGLMLEIEELD